MALAIDRQIMQIASAQDHIATRQQLKEAGISNGSMNRRIGSLLVLVASGVYSTGPPTDRGIMRAATLANPDGAFADVTAAELLKLPARSSVERSMLVPHGHGAELIAPGVRLRRTVHLPVDDVVEADLRHTTVERTLCDLAARQDPQRTKRLIEWCITNRQMTAASFEACLRSYCRSGRSGSALLRLYAAELLNGTPIPASELERRGVEVLERHGIDGWVLHHTPPWSQHGMGVVDLAWPTHRLIVELDGRRWHSTTEAFVNDRRRDRTAASHGWTVLRFSWAEVTERPRSFANEIQSVLRSRTDDDPQFSTLG